jgi:quercetin dioxygenase-like cupin family protein
MKKNSLFALAILVATCSAAAPSTPELRMTPTEITSGDQGSSQIGSSKLPGVHAKILAGNPAAAGFYSILLFVPPHTTIQAHSHRDDRMATVVSGTWHFGYGTHFDEQALKTLPVGSVYSEPGGVNHFARTEEDSVVVHISGFGPTDTRYFNPADDPSNKKKSE